MRPFHRIVSLLSLLAIALKPGSAMAQQHGAGPGQPPTVDLPPALSRVLRDYEKGWSAGNAAAVAALFAPRGMALPNGQQAAVGAAAITSAYAGPGGPLRLRPLAWATADSVGYIIGGYRYGPGDGDTGKFILALSRRADGHWLIVADIDNNNSRSRP